MVKESEKIKGRVVTLETLESDENDEDEEMMGHNFNSKQALSKK
jgi:hypothetical protein